MGDGVGFQETLLGVIGTFLTISSIRSPCIRLSLEDTLRRRRFDCVTKDIFVLFTHMFMESQFNFRGLLLNRRGIQLEFMATMLLCAKEEIDSCGNGKTYFPNFR
jgi:hypothetical protein